MRLIVPAFLTALVFALDGVPEARAATANVSVEDNFFSPTSVTINAGDSVRWTWMGGGIVSHNTTGPGSPPLWASPTTNLIGYAFTHVFPSAGSFPYSCTIHAALFNMRGTVTVQAANVPPSIALTAPTNNSAFAAPWTGTIHANNSDSDGTVTRLQFFANATLLGTLTNPPASASFSVTNLAAGNYTLKAVATDNGGATNSSAVVIQVLTPAPIMLSAPQRISNSAFQFSYSTTPGLNYVIDRSSTLPGLAPLATNTATSNPMTFIDNNATNPLNFYSVHLLPNP